VALRLQAEIGSVKIGEGQPVRVVGVINVSPESFYKESVRVTEETIASTALGMVGQGADIIDIGAMSTAPYLKTEIPVEEEAKRLCSAIKAVRNVVKVPLTADTKRSGVAESAIEAGAAALNDVSGLKNDLEMARLAADYEVPVVIVACETKPRQGRPIDRILRALKGSLAIASKAGIRDEKTILDPGIGFFRNVDVLWYIWDCNVLRDLRQLHSLGRPVYVGVSRKSFIGQILNQANPEDRLYGSLSATAIAVYNGAHVIRTHDVAATIQAVRLAERIRSEK